MPLANGKTDFILYTTSNGDVRLEVFLQDETLWLTQKMMADLFEMDVRYFNPLGFSARKGERGNS